MKFTIRQLEVFLAVAREGSISRAAEQLSMSQSAASAALQELEARYDMRLFERAGRRLCLSSFGNSVRSDAESLMTQIEAFDRELSGRKEQGDIRIGASYFIGNYMAVKFLAAYKKEHPQAKVALRVGSTPDVVAQVLNFSVDVGLIEAEQLNPDLILTPWLDDSMRVFCSPEHPYANKKALTDADLIAAEWILREPGSGHRQTFDRAMEGVLSEVNVVLELAHNEAIKNAVKEGLGISCLSDLAIAEEVKRGELVPLETVSRAMRRSFYFVTHKQSVITQPVKRWLDICRETIDYRAEQR